MRRSLALAAVAAAATATFSAPASAAPERPYWACDIVQNCVCNAANRAPYLATGEYWLLCI
jgi:hypothetical protein